MRAKRLFGILVLSLGLTMALLAGLHTAQATPAAANLFVKPDGDGTVCTQSSPCALQTALGQATKDGSVLYVAEGIYTGTGAAVITLTRSITLYGGWDGIPFGPPIGRNPAVHKSVLDGEEMRRVVHISGDITPTLDGFTIANGNATGLLLADCQPKPTGCGGGIFVLDAHPIIANNTITNNVATITATRSPTSVYGYGGGLYLANAARAVISGNLVISNAASTADYGNGGGIYLVGDASGMRVQFNQVLSNSATTTDSVGIGGGICGWSIYGEQDDVLIQDNVVAGNRTNSAGVGSGAGLLLYGGSARYLGNLVRGNYGTTAIQLQNGWSHLEGNQVVDNAASRGIQVDVLCWGSPTLVNNVVAHSGDKTLGATGCSFAGVSEITAQHNTLVGSGSGYGVYVEPGYVTLFLTNTIVTGHTWGITNTAPASSTVLTDHTLFWANTHDGIRGVNPVDGNPAFLPDGYHLGPGSAAIDVGAPTPVTTDVDGELRPDCVFWDIGADEVHGLPCQRNYLPTILRN